MIKILIGLLLLSHYFSPAQSYSGFSAAIHNLYSPDKAIVERQWNDLLSSQKIPLVVEDSVALLYRGEAKSVRWMGDFNGWGYDKKFQNAGTRIPNSDIWLLKTSFPADARLDYKIVVNDNEWILDPANPLQQ